LSPYRLSQPEARRAAGLRSHSGARDSRPQGTYNVGSLIPCKACDLGLRAAAPLLRSDLAHFTVVGDGPERSRLEQLARSLEIEKAVSFCGFLSRAETIQRMRSADVLVFPSVRDFGGG
jgi:glycosyltransferase involved in cell wall biosynthesis